MDKAKAYDEALERARKQRDDYQKELDKTDKNSQLADILRAGISAIELAFPELTESEDEKIRKSLIEFLTDIKEISESGRSVWAVRKEDAEMCKSSIAYLEKQKEQKSVSAEELLVKAGLKHYKDGNMWCIFAGDNIQEGICGFGNTIDEALYQFLMEVLEIQKEPKVDIDKLRRDLYQSGYNDGYQHGKEDAQKEQKSIEWNEEDEKIRQSIIEDIEFTRNYTEATTGRVLGKYNEQIAWFKSLPERFNLQPKQEWNEEDEMMRENIISDLQYFRDCATDEEAVSDYNDEINWLKDIFLNHKKFNEAVDKLWSNEWSEKDEEIIYSLRSFLILAEQSGRYGSIQIAQIERCLNWLKALRPQKLNASKLENFDPVDVLNRIKTEWPMAWEKVVGKQEWSEDDKQMIDLAVDAVEDFYNGGIRSKIINLLKSLYPSWKPSKKQMDALKNVAYGVYQNGDGPALRELYEQLLKLGVKEEQN